MPRNSSTQAGLSASDQEEVFRDATGRFVQEYGDMFATGMTDRQLRLALEVSLGIFGGKSGPRRLSVCWRGAGLKIWGGWTSINHVTDKPLFAGRATMKMARSIYGIGNPEDDQLSLL